MENNYPNGFDSWLDTFFHITCEIQQNYDEDWNNESVTVIKQQQTFGGHAQLKEVAKEWTDEFENQFTEIDWEEKDFYETLEEFIQEKNKL